MGTLRAEILQVWGVAVLTGKELSGTLTKEATRLPPGMSGPRFPDKKVREHGLPPRAPVPRFHAILR